MRKIHKKNPSPELKDFVNKEMEKGVKPVYEGGLDSKKEYKSHFFKIRKQLVEEQNYICCYCQQRINIEDGKVSEMKLEHFKPKGLYNGLKVDNDGNLLPDLSLEYSNFLAACTGYTNENTHCDSCKGGKELKDIPNLASQDFISFKVRYVAYKTTGNNIKPAKESDKVVKVLPLWNDKIKEAEKNNDLQQVKFLLKNDPLTGTEEGCLNLNHFAIQSRRYGAWQGIINVIRLKLKCEKNEDWHTEKGKKVALDIVATYNNPDAQDYLKPFCQVIIDLLNKEFRLS